MARARNIKPKFFKNDELAALSPLARLLFIGMWTIADYRGVIEYRPKRLKAEVLPYDECDIDSLVINLDKSGFIQIYTVQGQPYLKVLKFEQHQTPHKNEREAGSELPDLDKKDSEISKLKEDEINLDKDGTTRAESLFLNPSLLNPESTASRVARPSVDDLDFLEAWAAYPKRPGANRADALKAWSARRKEGVSPDVMLAGVRKYAAYVVAESTAQQFIKQAGTFFGPARHFESDWTSGGTGGNSKFNFAGLDRSGDVLAMEASMKRHGIEVATDCTEEVEI